MIRHVLLIRFKAEAQLSEIEHVKKTFLAISSKIEGIVSVEWGENDSPENLNRGFTHCVLMTFRDEESRTFYLPHPQHDALKETFLPCLKDIIVLDYTIN